MINITMKSKCFDLNLLKRELEYFRGSLCILMKGYIISNQIMESQQIFCSLPSEFGHKSSHLSIHPSMDSCTLALKYSTKSVKLIL